MHHITIAGESFSVTQTGKKFLSEYIARIESFLRENTMRGSYLQDIEDRLVEKLSHAQWEGNVLKDADIISIVNEIGEPEDIFASVLRENTNASLRPEKKKILKRNKRDAILFGVCAGIGDYFDVNPIWIRIFFIFLVVVGGTGILFYLFLALLLPVDTDKQPLPKDRMGFWEWLFSTTGTWIQRIFQAVVFLILALLAFSLGMMFFGFFVAGAVASWMLLASPFEFANQFFPVVSPALLTTGLLFFTLSSLVIMLGLFSLIFRKNFLWKLGWIGVLVVFGLSIIFSFWGSLSLAKNYAYTSYNEIEKSFPFTGKELVVKNNLTREDIDGHMTPPFFWTHNIDIEYATGAKNITVKMKHVFHTQNEASANDILKKFVVPNVVLSGGVLLLNNGWKYDFTSRIPYVFPARIITLTVPAGTKLSGDIEEFSSSLDSDTSAWENMIDLRDENTALKDELNAIREEMDTLRQEKKLINEDWRNQ